VRSNDKIAYHTMWTLADTFLVADEDDMKILSRAELWQGSRGTEPDSGL